MGEGSARRDMTVAAHATPLVARGRVLVVALLLSLLVPAVALAAFPGTNPNESVRANPPDDPAFDRCEPDNDGGPACTNVFGQEVERFGFAPNATQLTALYNPLALPTRQLAQNLAAGRNPLGQVSGVSADRAWKYFGEDDPDGPVGDPEVEIAILDTGIRWNRAELRRKVALNEGELPEPQVAAGEPCGGDDCDGDGAFTVDDYADDPRVDPAAGHPEAAGALDASDLLATFSDGADGDGNGYVDDIAGWDFFDDDNDPYDASSYSSASNHGSGRAEEAGAETDNGAGGTGLCPACRIVPLRIWDTFVVDTNQFGLATMYAADNDIEIVEGAVGGLLNSRFARETFAYAYERGTLPVIVSSDLNTANHNYPTNYNEPLHIQGSVADVEGLGENPPQELIDFLASLPAPLPIGTNLPVGTWFRNSGTTQYGGHAHLVMPAVTGSQATGQAAGAAGLIASYGNRKGIDLKPNEIKQLMTLAAEDVRAANTLGLGTPDPAQDGWDQHFGYGRLDLGFAIERVRNLAEGGPAALRIPPQALITSPDWFAPLNVAEQTAVQVRGRLAADRGPGVGGKRFDWALQWAPGIEPCEADFLTVATGAGDDPLDDAALGSIDLEAVRAALDARTASSSCGNAPGPVQGGGTVDPTAPAPGPGDVDPNEPAFTIRLRVTDKVGNLGEDRKVLFAYRDETLHEGWSRPIGGLKDATGRARGGGESSHRMFDLDGDNRLEIVEATSSGELWVLEADGSPAAFFNGGEPVTTRRYFNVHPEAPGFAELEPPREPLRIPAIGDIDGDREPEIVVSAGQHLYAWEADGGAVDGFPVEVDPSRSLPADRTRVNHVKTGFFASPALGDLDGDGALEITIAGLDQHLYAYRGDGELLEGFPVYLRERDGSGDPIPCSEDFECAESINTPAVGDITGDGTPEIVVATNEFDDNPAAPGPPASVGGWSGLLTNLLAEALGGSTRVYAVDAGGELVDGWPVVVNGILPDALPLVGPGVDHVLGDLDGDGALEVIGNAATGDVIASSGDGSTVTGYDSQPLGGEHVDKTKVLNLFENPIVADLDGGGGLEVIKGGQTLVGLVNLGVLVGQNLPYNHVLQAWDATSGLSLPAYPQAVEDYQLLSSPAVADVSDAPGNEAIVGTGLYLIRNLSATGVEGSGWPKFTGGWNFAVPAIGDVDGDGKLEVAAQTREGFAFLWRTDGEACDGGNDEWWTSRHDEWSTGAYGTDTRPPGSPAGLTAVESEGGGVEISWTAPGDDWLCGRAERFEVRLGPDPIDRPGDGEELRSEPAATAGETESALVSADELGNARYAAVLYRDDAGNWGRLASVELPAPPGPPPGPPGPGPCETVVRGTPGPDRLVGTAASETIRGRGGDDEIKGRGGEDCLFGGRGGDLLGGGDGNDLLRGGRGRDDLRGGVGDDRINGGKGRERIRGGRGDDLLGGRNGNDLLRGGSGRDDLRGGVGDDRIRGGKGRERIRGGRGDDRIKVRGGGRDFVRCGRGRDVVRAGRKDRVHPSCEVVRHGRRR